MNLSIAVLALDARTHRWLAMPVRVKMDARVKPEHGKREAQVFVAGSR
jgi:hypothetical protein